MENRFTEFFAHSSRNFKYNSKTALTSVLGSLLFLIALTEAFAQPSKEWDKTFGGTQYEELQQVQQTADGGYILGGYSLSGISGNKSEASKGEADYWVVKLNASGIKEWDKTIGGSAIDKLTSLQQTTDGGYILGGYTWSGVSGDKTGGNRGYADYWVVKLNASGDKEWDKTYGGNDQDYLFSVLQTAEGGYIIGGYSLSGISGEKSQGTRGNTDYWVVKLNTVGDKEWDKTYGGSAPDYLISLQQTADKGYILGGYSLSGAGGHKTQGSQGGEDYWIVKLNTAGDKEWDKTYGGSAADYLRDLQQTEDGGFILGGYSLSGAGGNKTHGSQGGEDYWVVKLNAAGDKEWDKTYGGSAADYLRDLQQTEDGGFILGGYSLSGAGGNKTHGSKGGSDYWVVKLNGSGNKEWDKTIGGSSNDDLLSIKQTADKGYILGGYSNSWSGGDKTEVSRGSSDYWVVKLAPAACSSPIVSVPTIAPVNNSPGMCGATVDFVATATGNPAPAVTYKIGETAIISPHFFPVGTTTVTATATNSCGFDAKSFTVTVVDNELPVLTSNGNQSVHNDAGTCSAAVIVSATATDNCSVGTPTGVRSDGLDLTALYPVGTTTITWSVMDANNNAAASVTQTVTVMNTPPVINAVTATLDPVSVNTAVNLTVSFTDNNVTKAAIKWGDDTPIQNVANPTSPFITTHSYSAAGVYAVKVILTDACNLTSSEYVYQYIVIYDPNGGFVTGGGWIDSPVGAYVADASLAGKATFGFVSKYQKGATVPSGQTQFQFNAAGFNFHSTVYEWLVISGHKAQYKGSGTVNGVGEYGFMLSAVDGQVTGGGGTDKFRMKVWVKATGAVVYDNQGGSDDAEATTLIGGGAIVIHEGTKSKSSSSVVAASAIAPERLNNSFYSYPTAFSDKTTIAFSMEKEEAYVLEVFDMKGSLVKRIANGAAEANKLYEFELRSDGIREGIYITRLTTSTTVQSLKMVLKR